MNNGTQRKFISEFSNNNREKFNEDLFYRNEDDIIEDLKKIILSCERNRNFVLKVHQFKVIDNYNEIMNVLYEYEENLHKNKSKKRDNPYDFVDIKNTDIKLLVVTYYIEGRSKGKPKSEYIDVIIAVPRIVNKYYFRISGNLYSAIFQIVESTYNSSTSTSSKKDNITSKAIFRPIRIYRNNVSLLTTSNEDVKCVFYTVRIYNKSLNSVKPFLARGGFYKGMAYLGLNYIYVDNKDPHDDTMYTFEKAKTFVSVPKYIFDNDAFTQSFVYGLMSALNKDLNYSNMFHKYKWIQSLGDDFNNVNIDKGISVLEYLEYSYDILTRETLRLPEEYKRNIYDVLRWMLREFSNLKAKDNLDVSVKRIRFSEMIASLYAMKISTSIYRISDTRKNNLDIENIKRVVRIPPMYLISAMTKCNLINYSNLVNDLDSTLALKYSRKGISGMGEKNVKSVQKVYKYIDPSSVGILDLDDSPKSDPGMSGTISPLSDLDNWSFSNYKEPNMWESEFDSITKNYKSLVGKKEVITLQKELLDIEDSELETTVDDSINTVRELMKVIRFVEETTENVDIDFIEEEE